MFWVAWAAVNSKAVVLLLLTFCLLLLPLWESVIVLCFIVRYFMSILVLQSSWFWRESWLLCLICLLGVSWWLSGSSSWCFGLSVVCDCGNSWSYSLTFFCNRLHAWWTTESQLATLLSSLVARRWVGLLWWFRLKDLSIDEMIGDCCFGCLLGPPGFTCWISFAPVFSFIYC